MRLDFIYVIIYLFYLFLLFSTERKEMEDAISPIIYTHHHYRSHTLERI